MAMSSAERAAAYRARDPERAKRIAAAHRARHPRRYAFENHRSRARRQGIEFLFTFEAWVEWWGDDFVRRGNAPTDLVCARRGDTGPYSPSNCVKLLKRVNVKHMRRRQRG